MEQLSEDDLNLRGMTLDELEAAWDLWFELAQHTNDFDPPYTHGVFQTVQWNEDGSVRWSGDERAADPRADPPSRGR